MSTVQSQPHPDAPKRQKGDVLLWAPILLTFPTVGLLIGWMVGASNTPVVGTALPLVFGVFGALGFGMLEHRVRDKNAIEKLASLDDELRKKVQALMELPESTSIKLVSFWASGILLFCVGCFGGFMGGYKHRESVMVMHYPSLEELLKPSSPTSSKDLAVVKTLTIQELALLIRIRIQCSEKHIRSSDLEELFRLVVRPVLAEEDKAGQRIVRLQSALDQFYGGSNFNPAGAPPAAPEPEPPAATAR